VAQLRLSLVDAFTDEPFTGNPAVVVMLDAVPSDAWMAAVAREMHVSDTAFVIRGPSDTGPFLLRWFTPTVEVDLCGHATLAAAHCLLAAGVAAPLTFQTRAGLLTTSELEDGRLGMDFPASPPAEIAMPADFEQALGAAVEWTGLGANSQLLVLLEDERTVRALDPDIAALAAIDVQVVIVTAVADAGRGYDFVSRVFAPNAGINEDPMTGSAHTVLGPYWAGRLGRSSLSGVQASSRPGLVGVEVNGDRVNVIGRAVIVMEGVLTASAVPTMPR
jgi:PhzF family phenazine biosynthesis protein